MRQLQFNRKLGLGLTLSKTHQSSQPPHQVDLLVSFLR